MGVAVGASVAAFWFVSRGLTCGARSLPDQQPLLVIQPDAGTPMVSHERATPPEVMATSDKVRPSWTLDLKLHETRLGPSWREHRAVISVRGEGPARAYAIGDLLPYGAVLVGVSPGAVQLMVADFELVYLDLKGRRVSLNDFRNAFRRPPPALVPEDKPFEEALADVLGFLRSTDPGEVQEAIDVLIAAGPPAVSTMMPFAESETPVVTATYAFAGSDVRRPEVYGDLIVGILEAITGQSFGDPMDREASEAERRWRREQWPRWWGVE